MSQPISEERSSRASGSSDEEDLAPYWCTRRWSAWLHDTSSEPDPPRATIARHSRVPRDGRPADVLYTSVTRHSLSEHAAGCWRWVRSCMCIGGSHLSNYSI